MMTVRYVCNMGKCIIESLLSFTYFLNVIGEIKSVFLIKKKKKKINLSAEVAEAINLTFNLWVPLMMMTN